MANSIKSLLEEAVKNAMRDRNKEKTTTLRMAISELKKEEIDSRKELGEQDSIKIIQRMIKQRKDSYNQFMMAERKELAEKENSEISILQEFLPKQLNEVEISKLVKATINETGATEPKDMGLVMGALKAKISGNADMGIVSRIVKENLSA
tara:strand:+ start:136 stop:588 length:453 start_codon:yes stop_codon:yes gene_type:complete